jgi:hypothetical protein
MTLVETISIVTTLYKKYAATPRLVQEDLRRCLREAQRTGAIPLGYRKDEGDKFVAWWLIYDETKLAGTELYVSLSERTPPGIALKIIRL